MAAKAKQRALVAKGMLAHGQKITRGLIAGSLLKCTDNTGARQLRLIQAMGYTFIALQGFDLIAAVGGEVRDPDRNLPRSMYLSLGIALTIYLPLLFLITLHDHSS